jgi:hypothetical protein
MRQARVLSAPAKASPAAATGVLLLAGLKAVLAIDGAVASGLERHSGLLSAPGADYGCAPRFTALVSSAARLFLFLGLTALLAALRRRVSAFTEEGLIFSGKRE